MLKSFAQRPKVFYGWYVTVAGLCITSTAFGVLYSFGVFFKEWVSEWSMSRGFLSGVFSLAFLSYGIASFGMGLLSDRYGPRITLTIGGLIMGTGCILTAAIHDGGLLYITWGIMVGIGVGTSYAPTAALIPRWFIERKGVAMGIVVSGLGLGTVAFAPFSGLLISSLDWRNASLVLGLIIWTVYLGGAIVIRRDPHDLGLEPLGAVPAAPGNVRDGDEERPDRPGTASVPRSFSLTAAMRSAKLWLLFAIHGFWVLGMTIPLVHLVPYATDLGLTTSRAALLQALLGGTSVLGRVFLGAFTERMGPWASFITLIWFQALAMLWLIPSHSEWMLWVFAVLFGFSYGGLASVFPLVTADLFGVTAFGAIFGLILLGATVGGTIGPVLAGFIFDSTKQYWGGFLAGALSMAIGGALSFLLSGGNVTCGSSRRHL
ncbi:MAG: MFS transporter [Pseudomonadota bacterium]